jgi:hypothetical protein
VTAADEFGSDCRPGVFNDQCALVVEDQDRRVSLDEVGEGDSCHPEAVGQCCDVSGVIHQDISDVCASIDL